MQNMTVFIEMLCGTFDNQEQCQEEVDVGNPIHPLARHIIATCNHKMVNLPKDFSGQFVIEESYFDMKTHQIDKHYLFLYEMISEHQVQLTSYNIPDNLDKETFTNANPQIIIDYDALETSPRFSPLILESIGDTFVGDNVSKFSEEHIFKFKLEITNDALYVTEALEKEGEIIAGYHSPIVYKRVNEIVEGKK
jgi:hypothetical protein